MVKSLEIISTFEDQICTVQCTGKLLEGGGELLAFPLFSATIHLV
jgi:hypothetical protein